MNIAEFAKVFPVGSHLCREPMPDMHELKKDMENLKKHGFNLIKLQEQWAVDNQVEDVVDLSKYEELIEHAAKLNMGVYYGFTMEQAPLWLYQKYPQAALLTKDGVPTRYMSQTAVPGDGKPGPCFDSEPVMDEHLKYIAKVVKQLSHYENIVIWNTWQEIGYDSKRIIGNETCYCDATIKLFQDYLKQYYGSLEELNRQWKSRYASFEQVIPNRHVGRFCLPNDIMFDYFTRNFRIQNTLKKRYQTIKATDPLNRPVFAHQGSNRVGEGIDFGYAKCQDFLGMSCYPTWFHIDDWDDLANEKCENSLMQSKLNEIWDSVALKFDYTRSANRGKSQSWAAEMQGGSIATGLYKGRTPSADDMRRWFVSTLASGTTAVSYWVTRAEIQAHEINGYSLLDSVGDTTERFEEVSRMGNAVNKYPELFNKMNLEKSEVAIMVSDKNYCLALNFKGEANEHLKYSIRGWHRLLWDQGVQVDFVDETQLDEDILNEYKMVIMPFPISLTDRQERSIKQYVQAGGVIISEACVRRISDHGYATRGEISYNLKEVFGVEHKDLYMIKEPSGSRWTVPEYSIGDYYEDVILYNNDVLYPNLYLETFIPVTAQTLLKNKSGDCAGSVNNYGKGKAYLIGTFIGHNGTAYKNEVVNHFVEELLDSCDIEKNKKAKLLYRRRIDEKNGLEALLITNPSYQASEAKFDISGKIADNILDADVCVEDDKMTVRLKPLDAAIVVLKNEK